MSDQVLSSEEVEAILKVTQEKQPDLSNVVGDGHSQGDSGKHYTYALSNINEMLRTEYEKEISSFLRKKVLLKTKPFQLTTISNIFKDSTTSSIYTVFRLSPNEQYGMTCVDLPIIQQTINLLYGGRLNPNEEIRENPGKVGTIIAEKLSQICITSFSQVCHEYGESTHEIIKTSPSLELATNLGLDPGEDVYLLEISIFFDEFETVIKLIISEEFFVQFIPMKVEGHKHKEKDFWRTAIKTQVVDSIVTINAALPEVNMKVKDFVSLKDGDIIPIGDPTIVYVCLNSLKLFKATAGQSNSKRVVKIINQI